MRQAWLLLTAVLLAGCSNGDTTDPSPTTVAPSPSPTPTGTPTPSPTPSPTPTPTPSPTPSPTPTPTPSGPITQEVAISDFQFVAADVTVPAGSTVHWTNADSSGHTVTADPESPLSFDSGRIAPEEDYSQVFSEPGTYPYHCAFHPSMRGTVTVTE